MLVRPMSVEAAPSHVGLNGMNLPSWFNDVVRYPGSGESLEVRGNQLVRPDGAEAARIEGGVIRFPVVSADASIKFYREVGGTRFQERSAVPFAMSSLDTPLYHSLLSEILP